MLANIFLTFLLLGSCTAIGYKYPHLRSCCPWSHWKPIHGPQGIPHSPKYISNHFQIPFRSTYGPPSHQPYSSQGFLNQNFDNVLSHGNDFSIGNDFSHSNEFANVNSLGLSPSFLQGLSENLLSPPPPQRLAHQKVLAATADEARLPKHLLNPFYKNPAIRNALAKHSWFGPGEKHVGFRETDKISRQQIYKVLSHAGLIRRR